MKRLSIAVTLLLVSGAVSAAENQTPTEARPEFIRGSSEGLDYRLFVPTSAAKKSGNRKLPLIVFLHGVDERGSDNEAQLGYKFFSAGTGVMARARNPENGAFILAPQAPVTDKWIAINKWKDPAYRFSQSPTPTMAALVKLLKTVISRHPIDQNRIYLTGLSMGGFGVFDLLAREPKLFAAALAVCGRGDPETAKKFASVPVYLVHGDKDKLIPVKFSRAMANALRKSGGRPVLKELKGTGHNAWDPAFTSEEIADWMFSKRREDE